MELAARALVDAHAPGSLEISSAGTHGFVDRQMDDVMSATLADVHGVQATDFLSRPLTRDLVADADLVVTAEASHRSFILEDDPGAFRKVFTLGQLAEAIGELDPALAGDDLLHALGERRGTAAADLDVADPYRRGRAAARRCADHIDTLLRVVVPVLARSERITPWKT